LDFKRRKDNVESPRITRYNGVAAWHFRMLVWKPEQWSDKRDQFADSNRSGHSKSRSDRKCHSYGRTRFTKSRRRANYSRGESDQF
jgi:hypothetical protein